MKYLISILAWALPTASVDSIVAGLTSFITKLDAAEMKQSGIASDAKAEIKRLEAVVAGATAEAERASRVKANIAALTA